MQIKRASTSEIAKKKALRHEEFRGEEIGFLFGIINALTRNVIAQAYRRERPIDVQLLIV
jgi:hypothetical protein